MRKRIASVIAAAALGAGLIAAPLSGTANANVECQGTIGGIADTPGVPGITITIGPDGTDPSTDPNTFYIDIRHLASDDYLFSIWIHQESNGVRGLQRGGSGHDGPLGPALDLLTAAFFFDDPCETNNPDTVII